MKNQKHFLQICLVVLAFLFTSSAFAQNQVRITLHQPPPNQLSAKDLWKMTLENTTGSPLEVYLEGYGEEQKEGRIVDGKSLVFTLPPGRSNYNYENFKSGNVNWKNSKYEEFIVRTGTVPAGTYTTCVTAYSTDGNVVGMEKCITQVISRGFEGEITLITPSDGENIDPSTPVTFSWSPLPTGGPYKIKIVEIIGNESPENAMLRNKAFFEKEDIRTTSFQYPSSAPKFVERKRYTWQVLSEGVVSEVYSFIGGISKGKDWYFTTTANELKNFFNIGLNSGDSILAMTGGNVDCWQRLDYCYDNAKNIYEWNACWVDYVYCRNIWGSGNTPGGPVPGTISLNESSLDKLVNYNLASNFNDDITVRIPIELSSFYRGYAKEVKTIFHPYFEGIILEFKIREEDQIGALAEYTLFSFIQRREYSLNHLKPWRDNAINLASNVEKIDNKWYFSTTTIEIEKVLINSSDTFPGLKPYGDRKDCRPTYDHCLNSSSTSEHRQSCWRDYMRCLFLSPYGEWKFIPFPDKLRDLSDSSGDTTITPFGDRIFNNKDDVFSVLINWFDPISVRSSKNDGRINIRIPVEYTSLYNGNIKSIDVFGSPYKEGLFLEFKVTDSDSKGSPNSYSLYNFLPMGVSEPGIK